MNKLNIKKQNIYFNNYLGDNPRTEKIILEEMNKYDSILITAPTGSGKTKTISDIMKLLPKNNINVLLTPNKVQSVQNEKDITYGLTAIVSGDNIKPYHINIYKENGVYKLNIRTNSFSAVYDKVIEIKEIIDNIILGNIKDVKVNLFVDEVHLLVSSYNFRKQTIKKIFDTLKKIFKNKLGKVIYMTATPDSLSYFSSLGIEEEINFIQKDYKSNVKSIDLLINKTGDNFQTFLISELLKVKKGFIRYNNKESTKEIIKKLEKYGKRCKYVNADEKEYDKETQKYKNDIYEGIINHNCLLSNYDYIFTTSMLDQGTSIKKGDKETTLFFIIDSPYQINRDNLVQFLNRFRFEVNKCKVLIQDSEQTEEFNSFGEILLDTKQQEEKKLNKTKNALNALSYMQLNRKEKEEIINYRKDDSTLQKENALFLDDEENLYIDETYLQRIAYIAYMEQYYYNIKKFETDLKQILNNEINIININKNIIPRVSNIVKQNESRVKFNEAKEAIENLNEQDIRQLENIIRKARKVENLYKYESNNNKLNKIFEVKSVCHNLIDGYDLDIKINKLLEALKQSKTQSQFNSFIFEEQVKRRNKDFINSSYQCYDILNNPIHYIIVKELFKLNDNNEMTIHYITNKEINDIAKRLDISERKTIKLIKMIFRYEVLDNKIKIRDLKIK